MTARDRFLARHAAMGSLVGSPGETAEMALGLCLRHVSDPSSVVLTDSEQELLYKLLYKLLMTMLATDDARDADSTHGADIRARLQRAAEAPIPPDVQERLDRSVAEMLAQVPERMPEHE